MSCFDSIDTLFWISDHVFFEFQSPGGLPYLRCGGKHKVYSSGATPIDLFDGQLAQPVPHIPLW